MTSEDTIKLMRKLNNASDLVTEAAVLQGGDPVDFAAAVRLARELLVRLWAC
jgi:hypothetical protein